MNPWASPLTREDELDFYSLITRPPNADANPGLGPGAVMERVTMRWAWLVKASDIGSADQPKVFDVTSLAADSATAVGATDNQGVGVLGHPDWLSSRTQDPLTGGAAKTLPNSLMMGIGGIGLVVQMPLIEARAFEAARSSPVGSYTYAAAADDALSGVHAAFEASLLEGTDGRMRKLELTGHEITSYGASRVDVYGPSVVETVDDEAGTVTADPILYGGQFTSKDRGWARVPLTVWGSEEQMSFRLTTPRSTPWPIRAESRFRVDLIAPGLIGRLTAGANAPCPPGAMAIGYPPQYGGR